MGIVTKELLKCREIFSWTYAKDGITEKKLMDNILLHYPNYYQYWIDPFVAELEINLLNTSDLKENIIRYYISKLSGIKFIYSNWLEVIFIDGDHREFRQIKDANDDVEKVILMSYEIGEGLFVEIQRVCRELNIDYLTICRNLEFPEYIFDSTYSILFQEEKKNETQRKGKELENVKEAEIKEDEKNELIGLGYKQPTEKSVLTVSQTALLIDYLQENKIILTSHLGKSKTAKIFSVLTKHSNNTLRPKLLGSEILKLKEKSENRQKEQFGNLKKLKEVLQNIVSGIDKEIENKEKL